MHKSNEISSMDGAMDTWTVILSGVLLAVEGRDAFSWRDWSVGHGGGQWMAFDTEGFDKLPVVSKRLIGLGVISAWTRCTRRM